MKILHINAGNMFGGVETLLVTLAQHAVLCPGMESSFSFCFAGRFSEELAALGAPIYSLGRVRTSRFWTVWQARRNLRQLLARVPFDVVICHMPWNLAVFGTEVKRAGRPLVFWMHSPKAPHSWIQSWARLTKPDAAICNSRFTASSLPLLFPNTPSEVVYCPVTLPEQRGAGGIREQLGVSKDDVVIVQVSRMEACKGHSVHLRALAYLKDVPGWTCWMIGGVQRPQEQRYVGGLRQQAAELGIAERVRFLGQRRDVPSILAASDIFCQPNVAPDSFGIVFIEALQAGLPVVTTRLGGAPEIVTEKEGYLAAPEDARSLADALLRLIQSPEERRALGRGGPSRARALCDPAKQMSQLYRALASLAPNAVPVTVS